MSPFEITIPVLNEEKKLESNVFILYNFLENNLPAYNDWKIVIADNGSTDETQTIGKKLEKENHRIKYIRLNEKGVGLALKTSWNQSNANIIGYMDLDLATDLKHFPEALQAIESGYDIVYGSRLNRKSKVVGRSLKREISSRVFNLIVRNYLGVHFSDGMCGFKFMKKDVFQKLHDSGAKNNGWFFSTELLTLAEWLNLKIFELPIIWTDSSDSHVKIIPLAMKYLQSMKQLKKHKPNHVKS